jgi:hypothetical protein
MTKLNQSPPRRQNSRIKDPEQTGVAPRARWRRRGAFPETAQPRTPYRAARVALARLPTSAILEKHEGAKRHTHARWSVHDRALHDELVSRTWGVAECSGLRMVGCPRWLEPLLHRMSPKGRRMARPG